MSKLCLIVASIFLFSACKTAPPLEVRDLVRNASRYNGQMVVVDGCFFRDLDMIAIGPCFMPSDDEPVWFTTYTELEGQSEYDPEILTGLKERNEKLSEKDKKLEEQLVMMPQGVLTKVRLKGEFRFSAAPQFGVDKKYRHELIVHRVLKISAEEKAIHSIRQGK
jgi:hypothetical protein